MAPVTRSKTASIAPKKAKIVTGRDPVVVVLKPKEKRGAPTKAKSRSKGRQSKDVEDETKPIAAYPEPAVVRHPPIRFGLIQELLNHNLFSLQVQTILWNQTRGTQAKPVLYRLLTEFPDAAALAEADLSYLTEMLYPIGLHNIRALRLIAFAKAWLASPPSRERRYRRLDYPSKGDGRDVKPNEILAEDDPREGWEVAHLPGMGAYALDTFRIFARDRLRGLESDDGTVKEGIVPEWTKVVPLDKDLRRYMVWRWEREGYSYDILTGKRKAIPRVEQLVKSEGSDR